MAGSCPRISACIFHVMSQKLESVFIKLPSPQWRVIGMIALRIDTDHFFKLNSMLYMWLSSCFVWRWYKIKPENHHTSIDFFIDRGKIWYDFNYCSTRYFVSYVSIAPLPFKSALSRFPALNTVRIRTRWARRERLRWNSPTNEKFRLEHLYQPKNLALYEDDIKWSLKIIILTFWSISVKSDIISITVRLVTLFRMHQMPHFLANRR